MKKVFHKIINTLENQKVSINEWVVGFVTIFFVRLLLESLSSPSNSGIAPTDAYTIIHYLLYFSTVTIGTIVIFGFFTKDYYYSAKMTLFGFPVVWMGPIIDIIVSNGKGVQMVYLFQSGFYLILNFLNFFIANLTFGATLGIRTQIALSILGISYLVYRKTKSKVKTFWSGILVYLFVFLIFSLPAVIFTITNKGSSDLGWNVITYLSQTINKSNIFHNTLREGVSSISEIRFLELTFNKAMSQILYILTFISTLFLFYKLDNNKFRSILKNSRPERITSYLLLLLCGSGYAYINGLSGKIVWLDFIGLLCLLVSWFCLWMHAVHTNDVVDINIDLISNKERPLTSGEVSREEMQQTGHLWLIFSLLGSWCAGFYPFFFSIIYICSYSVYSMYPLRLRRFPLVSSFLISIAGLSTILSGFFFVSADKNLHAFPIFLSLGIIIMITLAINTKDLKDVEGDRANGIMTIPTLFPKYGNIIVSVCFALSLLLVPVFLKIYTIFIFSIPCSLLGYYYINKKPYSEFPLFFVRFGFLFLVSLNILYLYIR